MVHLTLACIHHDVLNPVNASVWPLSSYARFLRTALKLAVSLFVTSESWASDSPEHEVILHSSLHRANAELR